VQREKSVGLLGGPEGPIKVVSITRLCPLECTYRPPEDLSGQMLAIMSLSRALLNMPEPSGCMICDPRGLVRPAHLKHVTGVPQLRKC
jgi:hypothetical protein